jgi:uncharacterized protein YbgA (DUF1722 family)/uncharacterized protein YbbK (DUF523 family)
LTSSSASSAASRKSDGAPIRVGVSACLLGERVRFDGGHKRDAFLLEDLGPYVEWVRVCPEVEIGLGTPRENIRLLRDGDDVRLVAPRSGADHTNAMKTWARRQVRDLARADLCGFVLKKDSPSCGLHRVRVYSDKGMPERNGRGLFAAALVEGLPLLPVEEEGRLNDLALRENFIERVFAYRRLKDLFQTRWTMGRLVAFHTAHKLQLLAHSPAVYKEMGRLVAEGGSMASAEVKRAYGRRFMEALALKATPGRNANVLNHAAGHLKDLIEPAARQDLARTIDDYRTGLVPLVVPVTLLAHYVRLLDVEYLAGQTYLEPHPKELMLRNGRTT